MPLEQQLAELSRWASQTGQELLGKPVIVSPYDEGLGRTHENRKRQEVEIEISNMPVINGWRKNRTGQSIWCAGSRKR